MARLGHDDRFEAIDKAALRAALAALAREDCEFQQQDDHEWFCAIHQVTMIGPEPVYCSVRREALDRAAK